MPAPTIPTPTPRLLALSLTLLAPAAALLLLSLASTTLLLPHIAGLAHAYALYLQAATLLCLLCLLGIAKKSAFATHAFATFLLLDPLLTALPRALLLASLHRNRAALCPSPHWPAASPTSCARVAALAPPALGLLLLLASAAQVAAALALRRRALRRGGDAESAPEAAGNRFPADKKGERPESGGAEKR